jgi:hypothetical protein
MANKPTFITRYWAFPINPFFPVQIGAAYPIGKIESYIRGNFILIKKPFLLMFNCTFCKKMSLEIYRKSFVTL